jgi:excinuclease UvrABC helicase subunit UvrB
MKKLALGIMVLALSSFTMASAPSTDREIYIDKDGGVNVKAIYKEMDGMEFRIIIASAKFNSYDVEVGVINLTKERLEIEKLKLEIQELK